MTSLVKLEKIIFQGNYKLAINILEKKISEEENHLYYFLLGECYLSLKDYNKAFVNIQKATTLNPYGFYKDKIYSFILNNLAVSGLVKTDRKKIILESNDPLSVHARALYPIADTYLFNKVSENVKGDYYLIPNWLSPYHPLNDKLDKVDIPVISMIVDRLMYAEEHIKANLIYSDVIVAMENYGIELYKSFGFKNVIYVPGAGSVGFDPQSYPKLHLEKKYDVLFVGNLRTFHIYRKRYKVLEKLKSLKSKYKILLADTANFDEYWTLMNQSKIIIDATIDSQAINYRMFQAMGIESLCFAEDDNLMIKELYQDRQEIVLYNLDNLDLLIDYYLKNPEESNIIAKKGYHKTINNFTHYHFMGKVMDKISEIKDFRSQKTELSKEKILMYSGITKHYQHKYHEAFDLFCQTEKSKESINNIFVSKLKMYDFEPDPELEQLIESYAEKNKDNFMIRFNYINYLFYNHKNKDKVFNLINEILKESIPNDAKGLYYLPEKKKKVQDYFKYKHGKIIFDNGLDSENYQKEYSKMLKEHLYRIKGFIELKKNNLSDAKKTFCECMELGSEHIPEFKERLD